MTATAKRRHVDHPPRTVPLDGSRLVDPQLGYLIAGYTRAGATAQPGETFYNAMWSRDRSGTCSHGAHAKCAHRAGGKQQGGVPMTGSDDLVHVWHCGCDCHAGQLYHPDGHSTPADAIYSRRRLRQEPTRYGQLELFEIAS